MLMPMAVSVLKTTLPPPACAEKVWTPLSQDIMIAKFIAVLNFELLERIEQIQTTTMKQCTSKKKERNL